jgi:hypothetical protein
MPRNRLQTGAGESGRAVAPDAGNAENESAATAESLHAGRQLTRRGEFSAIHQSFTLRSLNSQP